MLRTAWDCGINSPATTSAGRLFDAAAALIGVCLYASYEGEAPMRLESLCTDAASPVVLPLARDAAGIWRSDWAALLPALLCAQHTPAHRAATFHASMAQALCDQALAVRQDTGVTRVGLCGGVFQNRVLTELAQTLLAGAGFEVLIPQQLPVNDAAISFGQLVEAIAIRGAHSEDS
jgi:hydrogenase maturation protein HypF